MTADSLIQHPDDIVFTRSDIEARVFLTDLAILTTLLRTVSRLRKAGSYSAMVGYADNPTHWIFGIGNTSEGDARVAVSAIALPKSKWDSEQVVSYVRNLDEFGADWSVPIVDPPGN